MDRQEGLERTGWCYRGNAIRIRQSRRDACQQIRRVSGRADLNQEDGDGGEETSDTGLLIQNNPRKSCLAETKYPLLTNIPGEKGVEKTFV